MHSTIQRSSPIIRWFGVAEPKIAHRRFHVWDFLEAEIISAKYRTEKFQISENISSKCRDIFLRSRCSHDGSILSVNNLTLTVSQKHTEYHCRNPNHFDAIPSNDKTELNLKPKQRQRFEGVKNSVIKYAGKNRLIRFRRYSLREIDSSVEV